MQQSQVFSAVYGGAKVSRIMLMLGLLVTLAGASAAQDEESLHKVYDGNSRPRKVQQYAHDAVKTPDPLNDAINAVCRERELDPYQSVPIDVMQARPSLPLKNPAVISALRRAEQLLPVARTLTIEALREMGRESRLEESRLDLAEQRVNAVVTIQPEVDLRDNASVSTNMPTVISFGTIFLVGLPSNEGMLSVLAHELVHLADGKDDNLLPLFTKTGRRASALTAMRISGRRAEELTCDLIGTQVVTKLIARTPAREAAPRRLARSMAHNCVEHDDTDESHLSPRNTMRALLALDKDLAAGVLGRDPDGISQVFDWQTLTPTARPTQPASVLYASQYCRSAL